MAKLIDLHVHTTASDGTYSPSDIITLAKNAELCAIAITDHDTIDGVQEGLIKGVKEGIEIVPGVELSVEFEKEIHILGLFVDHKCEELQEKLSTIRSHRNNRNPKIIEKLNQIGVNITMDDVTKYAKGMVVGRPHIANAIVEYGYAKDIHDAFDKYIGFGKVAYVKKDKMKLEEAIQIIRTAKGIPIIAHPGHIKKSPQELEKFIIELKELGLMGIEVYHSDHNTDTTKLLHGIAKRNKMLISGGSDFHGENKPDIKLGTGLGNLRIEYSLLENMKNYKR